MFAGVRTNNSTKKHNDIGLQWFTRGPVGPGSPLNPLSPTIGTMMGPLLLPSCIETWMSNIQNFIPVQNFGQRVKNRAGLSFHWFFFKTTWCFNCHPFNYFPSSNLLFWNGQYLPSKNMKLWIRHRHRYIFSKISKKLSTVFVFKLRHLKDYITLHNLCMLLTCIRL